MTIEEIRSSGLLEQYVLGLLDENEVAQVETALASFPELKADIREIEQALHQYAKAMGISPRPELEDEIIESAKPKQVPAVRSMKWLYAAAVLALGLVVSLWSLFLSNKEVDRLQTSLNESQEACRTLVEEQFNTIQTLKKLNDPDARKLNMSSTPAYAETQLLFFINDVSKENFIQISQLPAIASGEVYQLWSLREGEAPMPLSTFTGSPGEVIPVEYIDQTLTYAITIEPSGGSTTPTLSKLISTVGV